VTLGPVPRKSTLY